MNSKYHSFGNIFLSYLRYRLKSILAFCLFLVVFLVVFLLYRLNMGAYLYAVLLSVTGVGMITIYDFWRYIEKDRKLRDVIHNTTVALDKLPPPGHLIEQDYRDLLDELHQEYTALASQADSSRSEMTDYYTMWAHQIKTPISAMRLLLQSGDASGAELEQELFKIEQYVEMVLQYLRLESMSADLTLREYPLEDLVRQAVKKYSVMFIHRKISLRLDDFHCTVLTDEKWMVFVLEQLLSNALKYTPKGEIHIYLDPDCDKALFIEDTGIGIQPEDVPRIFERGFTGYNGRMDKKSTGIGLYLCKRILGRLSHNIRIDSEVGVGTRVRIYFGRERIEIE